MKQKIIRVVSILILSIYLLSGCAATLKQNPSKTGEGVKVVTSFYPIYLHVINITKDIPGIEVVNMTEPQTGCLHDYQLTPNDLKTLDGADIFVINGGGMESFIDKAVSQQRSLKIIDASKNIDFIENENVDNHEDDHDHDINPHVWVGISGAIEQVKNIAKELGELDKERENQYNENANIYINKLEDLSHEMHTVLDHIKNKNIVTFHEAFPYFAKEFGLNIIGTIVTESGSEPSAKELAKVIEDIKIHNVKAIFTEPQYDSKAADLISNETKVKLYTLDPVVTGEANKDQMDDYLIIMKKNLRTLEEALK